MQRPRSSPAASRKRPRVACDTGENAEFSHWHDYSDYASESTKRKKSSSEVANAGFQLDLVKQLPIHYCHRMAHPFTELHQQRLNKDVLRVLELQIPARMFSGAAQSFVQMQGHYDSMVFYITAIKLFGYLALKAVSNKQVKHAGEDGEDDTVENKKSSSYVTITWERVPHKDDPNKVVCWRLRLTEHGEYSSGMLGELRYLIEKNEKASVASLSTGARKSSAHETCYTRLTAVAYRKLCMFISPLLLNTDTQRVGTSGLIDIHDNDITSPGSPYEPENVFNINSNLLRAERMGADLDYCNPATYSSCNGDRTMYRFANPENVYQIHESDLDPHLLDTRFLPHIRPDVRAYRTELSAYKQMHGIESDEEARRRFDITANNTSHCAVANDINTLTRRIADEEAERLVKYTYPPTAEGEEGGIMDEYHVERRSKQINDYLPAFREIFSPDGDAPPSIRCIAAAAITYVEENKTFSVLRDQSTCNLTRFNDMVAQLAVVMETIVTVDTAHRDCISYLFAAIHVYSRVAMNPHQLLLGAPGIGKSFALIILTKLLIDGTWKMFTYLTCKALAIPGKELGCLIMILEDAPSSTLGVTGGSGGKGKKASSDTENLMKQFLTSTDLIVQSITMEPKRAGEYIRSETSCIVFAAMNDDSSAFPAAMLDRFNVTTCAATDTKDLAANRSSMLGKSQRSQSAPVKQAMADIKTSWNRKQILAANILYMEACGILKTIDLGAADRFFDMVANAASLKGIDMFTQKRNQDRFFMMTRVLVVLNAIDLVWDSPASPILNQPHQDNHYLLVEKHLVATMQMAVFAIGLLSGQWMDLTRAHVISAMKKEWFPDSDAKVNRVKLVVDQDVAYPAPGGGGSDEGVSNPNVYVPRQFQPKVMAQAWDSEESSRKFWMYDSCAIGGTDGHTSLIPPMPNSANRVPPQDEVIAFLAAKIMPHLPRKYLIGEVEAKIKLMTLETATISRFINDGTDDGAEEVATPAQLIVESTHIRMALPTLAHAADENVLFGAVQDSVSIIHYIKHRASGVIPPGSRLLYGETETAPGSRHVWRTITADPDIQKRMDVDKACRTFNPNFSGEAEQIMTRDSLRSICPGYEQASFMSRLFAGDTPWTVQDMDIDKMAAMRRAEELGLSHEDQHEQPTNDRTLSDAQFHLHYTRKARIKGIKLLQYPECFERRNPLTFTNKWDTKFTADKKMFLASTTYEKMAARQRQRPSLYQRVAIPPSQQATQVEEADVEMDMSSQEEEDNDRARDLQEAEREFEEGLGVGF